jgi:hypothetical protein
MTLEHRLKFDAGLTIGEHTVELRKRKQSIRVRVSINQNGAVYLLRQPVPHDLYATWGKVEGDKIDFSYKLIVLDARENTRQILADEFSSVPAAIITLK